MEEDALLQEALAMSMQVPPPLLTVIKSHAFAAFQMPRLLTCGPISYAVSKWSKPGIERSSPDPSSV